MSSKELWASIEEALALCASDTAGLSHWMHFEYETYEPPGTQAFDALLALIEMLPAERQPAAVALAQERLSALPAHRKREVASDRTLPVLAASPAWPLIRSVTLTGKDRGSSLATSGDSQLASLEHICLPTDGLRAEAIDCLGRLSQHGSLRSIECQEYAVGKNEPLPADWIEALARLPDVAVISQRELELVPRWQLRKVVLLASPRAVELLAEKSSGHLQELSFVALDNEPAACFEALLSNRQLLTGLKSLDVTMDLTDDQFARLMSRPELSQLQRLSIRPFMEQPFISPEGLGALASATFVSGLTSLSLCQQPLASVGWKIFSRVPFERLTSLDLQRTKGDAAGMTALVNAPWFAGLQHLDLTHCDIGPEGASALASTAASAQLVSLDLGDNGINNSGIAALASSSHFQNLREIVIGDVGNWGFGELTRAGWFHQLESILVTAVEDSSEIDALEMFAASGEYPNLISFKFGYHATDQGLSRLAKAQNMPRLRRLVLQHNDELSARGIAELIGSPLLRRLWELNLYHCPIGDEGAKLLATSGAFRELVNLNISATEMTLTGSTILARSEIAKTLRWLNIDGDLVHPWLESTKVNPLLQARLAKNP